MKFILEKKINSALAALGLYLSFACAGYYFSRGDVGYSLSLLPSMYQSVFFANKIVAFFAGGILPFLFFEIVAGFSFRMLKPRIGIVTEELRYSLRFFIFAANIVIALLTLIYLISPLIAVYGKILIPFLVTTAFFALFIKFIFKHYIDKPRYSAVLINAGGIYLIVWFILSVLNMLGVI